MFQFLKSSNSLSPWHLMLHVSKCAPMQLLRFLKSSWWIFSTSAPSFSAGRLKFQLSRRNHKTLPPLVSRVPSWCTPVTPLWFRNGGGGTRYYFLYWEKTLLKWGPGTSAVWPKWSLIGLIGGATSKRWFSHGPIQFFWFPPIVR